MIRITTNVTSYLIFFSTPLHLNLAWFAWPIWWPIIWVWPMGAWLITFVCEMPILIAIITFHKSLILFLVFLVIFVKVTVIMSISMAIFTQRYEIIFFFLFLLCSFFLLNHFVFILLLFFILIFLSSLLIFILLLRLFFLSLRTILHKMPKFSAPIALISSSFEFFQNNQALFFA